MKSATVAFIALGLSLLVLTTHAATPEKTLVYCSEASPSTFNPQLGVDGATYNASSRMSYNRLVEFKQGTTEVIPSVASKWTVSKDGTSYTFNLRKDVAFQSRGDFKPTRNLNADDVVFTFNRMLKADHLYHKVSGGVYEYFKSMGLDQLIKSVTKVDDYTVRFDLTKPDAPFVANLGMDFASLLSAEYGAMMMAKKTPEKMDFEPIGTGPFVWKSYAKDNLIRFEAHPNYFQGRAKLDKVVFAITPDASVRFQRLKAGECQFIAEPSPQDLKLMKDNKAVQLISAPGLNVGYLAFNTQKPPLDKRDVRLAIYHALNRKAYLDAVYFGQAEIAKSPLPPTIWGYNKAGGDYDYNPEKAKKLLAAAGFKDGLDLEMWTLPVSRPYNPNGKKMGEMMQADLAKVGIRLKLVTYDWPTYLSKARDGQHQMLQIGWTGDNGDPDNFLNVLLGCAAVDGGSNYSRWCFKKFDDLIQKARVQTKQADRAKLYIEAQNLFHQEVPWVPLVHSVVFKALAPQVAGYKISPLGTENFYQLDIK